MNEQERNDFRAWFAATYCDPVLAQKGRDYSGVSRGATDDANGNFKRVADLVGLTPVEVCLVYMLKHLDSVLTYVKTGASSEPIYSRLGDLRNYVDILASLLAEQKPLNQNDNENNHNNQTNETAPAPHPTPPYHNA